MAVVLGLLFSSYSIYDDAYITYRYAENLEQGHGPVWNKGEKVEGCTSFAHMALNAAAIRAGLNPARFSQALNVLAMALIAALGYERLSRRQDRFGRWSACLFWLYFAIHPALFSWVYSGMETVLFVAICLAAILALERELQKNRLPLRTSVLVLIAALTRPEAMALGLVVGLCLLLFSKGRRFKNLAFYAAVAGAPFIYYFYWRFAYYGFFYPNTYYAKVGHLSLDLFFRGSSYLLRCLAGFVLPLGLIALLVGQLKKRIPLDFSTRLYMIFFGMFVFQVALTGGDYMAYGRFFLPALPICILAMFGILGGAGRPGDADPFFVRWLESAGPRRSWIVLVLIVLAVHFANPMFYLNHYKIKSGVELTKNWERQGKFLRRHLPEKAVIATSGIGAIGWFSKCKVIDILGLTDKTIAHTDMPTGIGLAGHEKFNNGYLLRRKPAVILVQNILAEKPVTLVHFRKIQRFRVRAVRELLKDPAFERLYTFSELQADGLYLTAFIRSDLLRSSRYGNWKPKTMPGPKNAIPAKPASTFDPPASAP